MQTAICIGFWINKHLQSDDGDQILDQARHRKQKENKGETPVELAPTHPQHVCEQRIHENIEEVAIRDCKRTDQHQT